MTTFIKVYDNTTSSEVYINPLNIVSIRLRNLPGFGPTTLITMTKCKERGSLNLDDNWIVCEGTPEDLIAEIHRQEETK